LFNRSSPRIAGFRIAILSAAAALGVVLPAFAVPDFCFLHISDNHITPQPVGSPPPRPGERAVDELAWFCGEAAKPQVIVPLDLTTPRPAFVIDTGDCTEYGTINTTWDNFEAIVKPLPVPLYISPGNHDYTWTGMMSVLRRKYGSDHYSFDRFGCHFACIVTPTPQEPLPSLERRTLTWLSADLRKVGRDTPVFLFCHHPLSTTEFAKPFEELRLLDLIRDHNVVLLMMGHGHGHRHEQWNTLDSVMGGTTSHPVESIGYNIVYVKNDVLHVAFRYRDPARPMEVTLKKKLAARPAPRISFLSPRPGSPGAPPVERDGRIQSRVQIAGPAPSRVTLALDDEKETAVAAAVKGPGVFEAGLDGRKLAPGLHYLLATAAFDKETFDDAEEFLYSPPSAPAAFRTLLASGVKAGPVVAGSGLIVAGTDGRISLLSFSGPRPSVRTLHEAGVEILHAPALDGDRLYVPAAEKGVLCLTLGGKVEWQCDVKAAVYGTPALDAGQVYVADMEGVFHAIDRRTGRLAWSKRHALFSIEMPVTLAGGTLYGGAWDGFVYAVNAADGTLKWKQAGPGGQDKLKSRYYAPADCPCVAVGDRLFVTDRAYRLGAYNLQTGSYLGELAKDIAAIGPAADGKGFYARGLARGVSRHDGNGKATWSDGDLRMGRFPCPPVEAGGKVFSCSNLGLLTVHSAADGKRLLQYQASPQLHVMAPVATDGGSGYVAGMDGWVTRIRLD
jgi:outer membrane protein assembly factor BamB